MSLFKRISDWFHSDCRLIAELDIALTEERAAIHDRMFEQLKDSVGVIDRLNEEVKILKDALARANQLAVNQRVVIDENEDINKSQYAKMLLKNRINDLEKDLAIEMKHEGCQEDIDALTEELAQSKKEFLYPRNKYKVIPLPKSRGPQPKKKQPPLSKKKVLSA